MNTSLPEIVDAGGAGEALPAVSTNDGHACLSGYPAAMAIDTALSFHYSETIRNILDGSHPSTPTWRHGLY